MNAGKKDKAGITLDVKNAWRKTASRKENSMNLKTLDGLDAINFKKWFSEGLPEDCWEWRGSTPHGYGNCYVAGYRVGAHRASWLYYNGNIPEGMCVCHTCDNRACVNPGHLFLGTRKDNAQDSVRKGRWPKGGQCRRAKLSAGIVAGIRSDAAEGYPYKEVGKHYGISGSYVGRIVRRERWR